MRQEKETQLKAALESLRCDTSDIRVSKVAANFEGMLLMERYLGRTACSYGGLEDTGEAIPVLDSMGVRAFEADNAPSKDDSLDG